MTLLDARPDTPVRILKIDDDRARAQCVRFGIGEGSVVESAETVTYSGSRSCPIVGLPGPNGTIDGSITPAARPLNPSVVTLACVIALPVTSMMLIEPSGSTA